MPFYARILVLISLVLAGCSGAPFQGEPPSAAPQPTFAGEHIPLTVWLVEQENGFYSRLAEEFERENPQVNVILAEIPAAEYAPRFERALSRGSLPDAAFVLERRWVRVGAFLPLDQRLRDSGVPTGDFNPGAMAASCIIEGQTYCVGSTTSAYLLLYNRGLFAGANLIPPSSITPIAARDFAALARALPRPGAAFPLPALWLEPRTLFSPDGRTTERLTSDQPTADAYETLAALLREGAAMSPTAAEGADGRAGFLQGRLALWITASPGILPALEAAGLDWGAALVPTELPGDPAWTAAWTDGMGVPLGSPHPKQALQWVAFLATRGPALRAEMGEIPLNTRTAQAWAAGDQSREQVVETLTAAHPGIYVPNQEAVLAPLAAAFTRAVVEGADAKTALDAAAPEMQALLDQVWSEFP